MVIGDNPEKQLAPYHEYECTGNLDEYIQDVDITDEVREDYESSFESKMKASDGTLYCAYDDKFYRDPTEEEKKEIGPMFGTGCSKGLFYTSKDWSDGLGYRAKVHFTPEGYEEIKVPSSEAKSFLEFCEDHHSKPVIKEDQFIDRYDERYKWGWIRVNSKVEVIEVIQRTNPNAKWDWYSVGGRWSGYFPVKLNGNGQSKLGKPGAFGNVPEPGTADQLRVQDVDFDRAYSEAEAQANNAFDDWEELFLEHEEAKGWNHFRDSIEDDYTIDQAREDYNGQALIKAHKEKFGFTWGCPVDSMGFNREEHVERCKRRTLVPFAVVKDSKWYEKGEMGWWGMTNGEKDEETWNKQFQDLVSNLHPDTLLTLVDCHI
jgi:hypothetical protein